MEEKTNEQRAIESLKAILVEIRKYPFLDSPAGGQLPEELNWHITSDLGVAIENIQGHLQELTKVRPKDHNPEVRA
jgi:hypothetical protein